VSRPSSEGAPTRCSHREKMWRFMLWLGGGAERFGVGPAVMLGQHLADVAGPVGEGAVTELAAGDRQVGDGHREAARTWRTHRLPSCQPCRVTVTACSPERTTRGIMWVSFAHLRPPGHIMPDHAGETQCSWSWRLTITSISNRCGHCRWRPVMDGYALLRLDVGHPEPEES